MHNSNFTFYIQFLLLLRITCSTQYWEVKLWCDSCRGLFWRTRFHMKYWCSVHAQNAQSSPQLLSRARSLHARCMQSCPLLALALHAVSWGWRMYAFYYKDPKVTQQRSNSPKEILLLSNFICIVVGKTHNILVLHYTSHNTLHLLRNPDKILPCVRF